MLNQVVIVGRLVGDPTIKDNKSIINLAVNRPYKNAEGGYDTDFISCVLYNAIASNTAEYCKKGDLVGIKGRIESIKMASEDVMQIVAEKITFLSTKKKEEMVE